MSYVKYKQLKVAVTCADDTTVHTVKFQPIEDTYDNNAVTATQGTTDASVWYATLDEDTIYDIYIDDSRVDRVQSLNGVIS